MLSNFFFASKNTENMKFYCICYFCWILLCSHLIHAAEPSGKSASSCENLFQYKREGDAWIGLIQTPTPVPLVEKIKMEVMLLIRAPLPSQDDLGSLDLYGTRQDAIRDIQFSGIIRYRLLFPLQNPLPELIRLTVNGRVLCSASENVLSSYGIRLRLEHTLFIELTRLQQEQELVQKNQIPQQDTTQQYIQQSHATQQYTTQPHSIPEDATQSQITQSVQPLNLFFTTTETAPFNASQSDKETCGRPHVRFGFSLLLDDIRNIRGLSPWLVAVYVNKDTYPSFQCGGTLISARTVVTAASCFRTYERTYKANEVALLLGRYNILNSQETGIVLAQVQQLVIHSDYLSNDLTYDANIAMAIMTDRVEFSDFIRPICLWEGSDSLNYVEGKFGSVVGWGRDGSGSFSSPTPKTINVPIVSDATCLRSSDTFRYITSNRTFCAGGRDERWPCFGDSGNGMAFKINNRWFLRGIVSAAIIDPSENTCKVGEYVVFTDVAKFVSWIQSNAR